MKATRSLFLAVLFGATALAASAQTAAEHTEHHSDGTPVELNESVPRTPEQQMNAMDRQIQSMREISRKLADARTPQARQALMAEHQNAMRESMRLVGQIQRMSPSGMGMMGGGMMGGAAMPGVAVTSSPESSYAPASGMGAPMMGQMMQRHAMMEKRMAMMETMIQMLMEVMPNPSHQ